MPRHCDRDLVPQLPRRSAVSGRALLPGITPRGLRLWRSISKSRSNRMIWPVSTRSSSSTTFRTSLPDRRRAPAEMWEKVPQAVNLNTWPATLFVGRDGRVKHIHTGFASPCQRRGIPNAELKAEFTSTIEQLLKARKVRSHPCRPPIALCCKGKHLPGQVRFLYFLVPGWHGSGPAHWQAIWRAEHSDWRWGGTK